MKKYSWVLTSLILFHTITPVQSATKQELLKVKQQMIQQSINQYQGNCPCPYNIMRNGRSCGKSSAYSRPGGVATLCFVEDITDREAEAFLKQK